jgi:hypothetical protein
MRVFFIAEEPPDCSIGIDSDTISSRPIVVPVVLSLATQSSFGERPGSN